MSAAASTRRPDPATSGRGVLIVFGLGSLAGVVLSAAVASGRPVVGHRWSTAVLLAGWTLAWLAAAAAAARMPGRRAVPLILAAGLAVRLAALAGPPATSDDLYRYAWDGRAQAAGVDSYAQPPASRQLAALRETWLWPDPPTCAAHSRPPGCTRINRPSVRTIYPPVAEAWFAAVYRVAGIGARHKAWQVAGLVTELAALGLLVGALGRWGQDRRWVAWYALAPAPALEIVNNGHVDGLAVALMLGALALLAPDADGRRGGWREAAAVALITGAGLVKLYPAVLLLPVVACRPSGRLAALVRTIVIAAGLSALAYASHVVAVGSKVLGYLPGYLKEENYRSGGRFLVAHVLHVPHGAAGVVSLLGVGGVAIWVVWKRPPRPAASAALIGAVLLAASPAQPWYAVSLLALAALAGRPLWAAVVVAGYAASLSSAMAPADAVQIGGWAYTAALVLLAAGAFRHRAAAPARATADR